MKTGFVFLFLLVLAVSHATTVDIINNLPLSLPIIITIMIIVLALIYMLSDALSAPGLKAWVKGEIREMIVAGILFVAVMGIFTASVPLVETLTGVHDYQESARVIANNMLGRAIVAYQDLIRTYFLIGMRTGFSTNIAQGFIYFVTASAAPYSGYAPFFTFLSQASGGLTNMVFIYESLKVFLDFFLFRDNQGISLLGGRLIYFAFALRFIPFTRQLGSTLIAIIIGAYILFPASIMLVGYFHSVMGNILPLASTASSATGIPLPMLIANNQMQCPASAAASSIPYTNQRCTYIESRTYSRLEFSFPPGSRMVCGQSWQRILLGGLGEIGFAVPPCVIVAIAAGLASFGGGAGPAFNACFSLLTSYVYPAFTFALTTAWSLAMIPSTFGSENLLDVFDGLQPFFAIVNNLVVVSYVDSIAIILLTLVGIRSVSLMLGGEYMIPGIQRLI